MKYAYIFCMCLAMLCTYQITFAQAVGNPYRLGEANGFLKSIKKEASSQARVGDPAITLRVSERETFVLHINVNKAEGDLRDYLIGDISNISGSSFFIKGKDQFVEGNIILKNEKRAFKFFSDESGNAFVQEVEIGSVICIDFNALKASTSTGAPVANIGAAVLNLQSLPGARGCVLLDFDGQNVSGTPWNNGNPINAAPSGMSDADIQEAWELISEDYRPFHVNITTSEAVFNSYAKTMRMRVIFTPTNTAAPGAGGVAYIGSFNWNDDTPCWSFTLNGKYGGEAASHEIGHTFGLGHDGRISPAEEYYGGQGDWSPIMGVGYYKPITQWSRGEYNSAKNTEDDLAKISSATYNVGYRNDDYGNATGSATAISAGSVSRSGLIERTGDMDFFSFNSGSGTISLSINTVSRHGDLDIIARLYNSAGAVIGTYNPAGLNASISANVSAGTYYLSVDGTGAGNPATDGYSDYASLGSYSINGTIPVGSSSTGVVTVYQDCAFGGASVGIAVGDYTMAQLGSLGVSNDWVSSVKVSGGFEFVGYQNDNFTGTSIVWGGNDDCLVDNGANDWITSVRVRTTGVTTLSGGYYLQNRNSGLYMDVAGPSSADGANIAQWTYTGATNQQYDFVHLGAGVYRLTPRNSGKCVDVAGVSTTDGANINQWTYVGGANQQFIAQATGDGFYRLIAKHSGKIIEVGGSSTAAGGNIQQWTNNNQLTGQWKLIPVTTSAFTSTIQAESYSTMLGVQLETTTDAGGGQNVGWIDNSDWMAYNNIAIPTTGTYLIEYRVASPNTTGVISLDLNAGATQLGTLGVPNTGGWQTWQTISRTVTINAGTYNFGIFASVGGFNLNWWRITRQGAAAPLAMSSEEETESLSLYPNPAADEMYIKIHASFKGGRSSIVDDRGAEKSVHINSSSSVDVSDLQPGLYTFMITKDGKRDVKRFVKK